jgi:hypothetical protein
MKLLAKRMRISSIAERLLPSQERLCSMELLRKFTSVFKEAYHVPLN